MSPPTADALCYFDTNALWKFYQDEKGDVNIRRLVARSPSQVLISSLTMLEFIGVLMKYYRQGFIRRRHVCAIAQRLRRDSAVGRTNRPFLVTQIPDGSFREAQGILLQDGSFYALQANDALHLAIVVKLGVADSVVLVTSDGALQNTAQRRGVDWYDPEDSGWSNRN